jgi:uncharacterized membrane protein
MSEILLTALKFYLVYSSFGLVGLLLVRGLFKRHNLAWQAAKAIGLLIFAWFVWMLASIGLIDYNNQTVLIAIYIGVLIISLGLHVFLNRKQLNLSLLRKVNFKTILLAEAFTFAVFVLGLTLRGFNANLEGTERFMDMHMLASASKASHFPFVDIWDNLKPVNYYYYGFYILSILIRLTGLEIAVGYNVVFVFIFVLGGIFAYYIASKLTKSTVFSLLAALFAITAGNLHYTSCVATNALKGSSIETIIGTSCFYPVSTRVFEDSKTINEISSYSFLLGDLHPHVIAIPFFLLTIYLLLKLLTEKKISWRLLACIAFLIANLSLINSWDFATLGLILFSIFAIFLVKEWKEKLLGKNRSELTATITAAKILSFDNKFYYALGLGIVSVIAPFILFFPFFHSYKAPVGGIGAVLPYTYLHFKDESKNTINFPEFVYYFQTGANWNDQFLRSNLDILSTNSKQLTELCTDPTRQSLLKDRCALLDFTKKYQAPSSINFLIGFWGVFIFTAIIGVILLRRKRVNLVDNQSYYLLVFITLALIVITETVFVKEIFHIANPPYFRANTVFKFGYHAWLLAGILTAVSLSIMYNYVKKYKHILLWIAYTGIFFAVLITNFTFTILATYAVYLPNYKGLSTSNLNGAAFISNHSIADQKIVDYLNATQYDRVTILESVGDSYTYNARIGAFTGMPNIVNWPNHEYTWRFGQSSRDENDYGYAEINDRVQDVKKIYTTDDVSLRQSLLEKYDPKYIVISAQERSVYGDELKVDALKSLGKIVVEYKDNYLIEI